MPSLKKLPKLRSHVTVFRQFGKKAFLEVYERPTDRKLREWFLFESEDEPCVVIFALTRKGDEQGQHVVTLRHFRYGAREIVHELPGGGVEKIRGVTREEWYKVAVKKELKQETACDVEIGNVEPLGVPLWFEPAAVRAQFQPMLALDVVQHGEPVEEDDEFLEPKLMPVGQWYNSIALGKVTDAKSIAVSLVAIHRLPRDVRTMALDGLRRGSGGTGP